MKEVGTVTKAGTRHLLKPGTLSTPTSAKKGGKGGKLHVQGIKKGNEGPPSGAKKFDHVRSPV